MRVVNKLYFKAIAKRILVILKINDPDRFLKKAKGVIHIGANIGQERDLYYNNNLPVLWVEPIPEIFKILQDNLVGFSKQIAFQELITDIDDGSYSFNISNNNGASSSILDFNLHKSIWPDVAYDRTISLQSITLTSFLKKEGINIADYDTLIMDTQGSELRVLKGAASILHNFKFIKTEVPDFESYKGCCQLKDINEFLSLYGFRELSRNKFIESTAVGNYYDIVYERKK